LATHVREWRQMLTHLSGSFLATPSGVATCCFFAVLSYHDSVVKVLHLQHNKTSVLTDADTTSRFCHRPCGGLGVSRLLVSFKMFQSLMFLRTRASLCAYATKFTMPFPPRKGQFSV
jgi:hypothetical protein